MKEEIALKSGYYFMTFKKDEIPFFYELRKTNKQILKDEKTYDIYEAPTWEIAQKVDAFMGNNELGFSLDDYLVEKKENPICCICHNECENEWGNNPYPYIKEEGARCCDSCNYLYVIPARVDEQPEYNFKIKNISCSEVKELRNKNYEFLVLQDCEEDLEEFVDYFINMLNVHGIINDSFSFKEIYSFNNGGLTNLAFALDEKEIDMERLATFRLEIRSDLGAMWLSDYIENGYIQDIGI